MQIQAVAEKFMDCVHYFCTGISGSDLDGDTLIVIRQVNCRKIPIGLIRIFKFVPEDDIQETAADFLSINEDV